MIQKRQFQTTVTDATSPSPHIHYRPDLLIQYKSAKMKNRIPDWRYTEGRIRLQKVPEFHEKEEWILLTVFTSFCIYVALCVRQTTEIPFTSTSEL